MDYSRPEELIVAKRSIFRSFKRFLVQNSIELGMLTTVEEETQEEHKEGITKK